MNEIKHEIVKEIGILSETTKGWRIELNLVSWNEKEPKYDLRSWSKNHEKIGKGITVSKEELIKLKQILDNMDDINNADGIE